MNNRLQLPVLYVTEADWRSIRKQQRRRRIEGQLDVDDYPFGDYEGLPLQPVTGVEMLVNIEEA